MMVKCHTPRQGKPYTRAGTSHALQLICAYYIVYVIAQMSLNTQKLLDMLFDEAWHQIEGCAQFGLVFASALR